MEGKERKEEENPVTSEASGGESGVESSGEELIPVSETERREQEAYLRGRNEAVEAKIVSELHTHIPNNQEPGIESIFSFRESVWSPDCGA